MDRRDGCRRLAALTGVLGAAVGLTLAGAGSASAGGPTSVLIVSPESSETASLYYSDRQYGALERLLGDTAMGTAVKPPEADLVTGPQINVTWMLHDVSPWRVDRVYPGVGSQDVWIHTAANLDATTNGTWHRAGRPTVLRNLLKDLGVMGKASGDGNAVEYPPPWDMDADSTGTGAPESAPATAPAPARRAESADGADWGWAAPGLAVGVAAGVGGTVLIRRAAGRLEAGPPREEPRQELIDL
ncbi:hypothetical protein [Streptomyces sp. NPDC046909]|uniref:hypothetical protein n=1 Tax=Streptomyces sp. NPDC046909 TaxID=3155617 RepID=UPI0033CD56AE